MFKKTCAAGSLAIAATAGILLTGSPASAQGPTLVQGHRGHHIRVVSVNRNRNRNVNVNRNRVIVRVRVHNRNNNVAVANNRNFGRGGFFRRDGFFGRDGLRDGFFFRNRNCCRRFDDDFGGLGGFGRGGDRIRAGDVSVRLGRSRVFDGFGRGGRFGRFGDDDD